MALEDFEESCPTLLLRFAKRAVFGGKELTWWLNERRVETEAGFVTLIPILRRGKVLWQRRKPDAFGMRGRRGGIGVKGEFAYPYYWMASTLTPTQAQKLLNRPPQFQLLRIVAGSRVSSTPTTV